MKYKAAIFDLDGTLLDTLDDLWDAVNDTMDLFHFPRRTRDEVRAFVGNGVERLIELCVPDGRANPAFGEAVAYYRRHYAEISENKTRPYTGIPVLLRRLRDRGVAVAVVSNKMHEATVTLCAKYFPEISIACGEREAEGIRRKPYPDMVIKAAASLGCSIGDCVYIGDSEVDIQTARNAGMDCISVLWGFRDESYLRSVGGSVFVTSVEELYDRIAGV